MLGSVGTTSLDRRIQTSAPGEDKESLQLERQRVANQELADAVHAATLKMLADVERYAQAQQAAANSVVKSYQEQVAAVTTYMTAFERAAAAERAQLAQEANRFAPKIKSYQEVIAQIGAYSASLREMERQETQTFRDTMQAQLKAADAEIEANQRVLRSLQEKREAETALNNDTAEQRRVVAAADIYDKYYTPAVNRAGESSLGFVRSITGLVSASNLLGVSGNNAALNILTMAASFDRMGVTGLALGGTIGIILAGIGSLIGAYNTLKQATTDVIGAVVSLTERLVEQAAQGFASAVKSASDYQQQLAFIAGLLRPTTAEFEALNAKVESVAQTTVFGMGKATEAVSELARAGNSLTDIINKGALDAVVNLAQAANGELNLGDAAKSVTSIVGAYTQVVNGALTQTVSFERAANALTGTAQLSRLSFLEVLQAWRQAAPIAASTKISVEDLGATIAILANASETGSISGTALKQVILDLEKPSKAARDELNAFGVSLFTSEGKIRPFRDVIIDMNKAFGEQALIEGKVTEEEQKHALAVIFGARAALAANILTNQGAEAFDRMRASMNDVKAVDLANIMLLPLNARLEILKNTVDAAGIAMAGPFLTGFSDLVNAGIKLAQSIPLENIRLFGQAIVAVATNQGVGVLRDKLEELASGNALQFFNSLVTFGLRIREAFTEQILPAIEGVAQRIIDFATSDTGLDQMARTFDTLGNVVLFVGEVVGESITKIAEWIGAFLENKQAIQQVIYVAEGLAAVIAGTLAIAFVSLAVPLGAVISILGAIGSAVDPLLGNFANLVSGAETTSNAVGGSFEAMADAAYDLPEATGEIVGVVEDDYKAIAEAAVDSAEVVSEASNVQADNVTSDMNDMVQAQATGWNTSVQLTQDSTQDILAAIYSMEKPFENLERAPQNVAINWMAPLQNALNIISEFVNGVLSKINELMSALAQNPLFQGMIGVATFVGPLAPVLQLHAFAGAVGQVHEAWEKVDAAVNRISNITIPTITRQSRESAGGLRSLLDGLGSAQERANALRQQGDRSTAPGEYPGSGGGGGKGGKGGAGRGPGAGPENAYNRAIDQATELAEDLSQRIQKAGQQALEKLADIAIKANEQMIIEAREYVEKRDAIIQKADEERDTTLENFRQSRADRTQRKSLDDVLKLESQTRTFERQARDYRIQDTREAEDRQTSIINRAIEQGLSQRQAQEARGYKRLREDQDVAYNRQEEDTERHLRKIEDLQKKHTERQTQAQQDAIRGGLILGFSRATLSDEELERRRLDRQRANEDKNLVRARNREDEDINFGLAQQAEAQRQKDEIEGRGYATTVRRRTEDRTRSRQDALDDASFTEHQAEVRQSLEDNIEAAGIIRRLQKIEQDKNNRLAILDREHKEREDKIRAAADNESRAVLGTLNNQLQDVQRTIIDKAPEIIKSGGEAMQPIMDAIVQNLQDQMDIVYNAASDAREELGLAIGSEGAQSLSETVIDSMADAIDTYTRGMVLLGQAAHTAAEELFNAVGKPMPQEPITITTPGLPDTTITPQPNLINSIPNNNGVPLPSTSSVIAPVTAGDTTINNTTTYQVDANYGATQSPASIGLDLSAISAIGRG